MLSAFFVLWLLVLGASWLQSLTGFAFGLIVMSGVGLFKVMSLSEAAIITGILTILNCVLVLYREMPFIHYRLLVLVMLASLPGLALGYGLLHWLESSRIMVLQLILGFIIVIAALQMLWHSNAQQKPATGWSFMLSGLTSGIMAGMFSTAGPPVIWQMYRQPLAQVSIRATLLAIFLCNGIARLGLVFTSTGIAAPTLLATAGAIPMVIFGTFMARRYPPGLSTMSIRRLVTVLLLFSGLALSCSAVIHWSAIT